jgi:NTP pyrophosphatase (non-canonical NTP hydrolase)
MPLTFHDYQTRAAETAKYPNAGRNPIYPTLGLAGEAGEVCEKVKKVLRDRDGDFDAEAIQAIQKELGDVLWYVARLAAELGLDMETIAADNLAKLASRKARGVLGGSGDER